MTPPQIPQPNFWDRHVVPRLICCACGQPQIMKRRSQIVPQARGKVLEFGAGGGINAQFYNPERIEHITGIDPSAELLDRARDNVAAAQLPMDLVGGVAEALPFENDSFDTVLITFTLCSVQDQAQALKEARRVLKPDGQLLFLEHGAAPDPGVHLWQRRVEPIWKRIAGGCHLTRPIADAVRAQGFHVENPTGEYMPKTPRILGWVESGVAIARGA
ncbi:class I SAM-dependent methyltransferase [Alterisphingorhabdus coralli]|uniref:Class I SAM-dependent methyltransferase n=1 Tax=Alterisphingorhabdus coralli TaxID=3071408 RepID=A0AA97FAJ0_9SPHN|nr:class I SAM-dependent methyltransferase [Parasphingorhabdus sp. SCSIO 66989]WOE76178.1 class I SAM-dependent methyltransferase [Parasphingorhabdus sp. SCSIO 66989]